MAEMVTFFLSFGPTPGPFCLLITGTAATCATRVNDLIPVNCQFRSVVILTKISCLKILPAPWFLALWLYWPTIEIDLLLCQPPFGPFQVASTLRDPAAAAVATVLVPGKHTQILCILKESPHTALHTSPWPLMETIFTKEWVVFSFFC